MVNLLCCSKACFALRRRNTRTISELICGYRAHSGRLVSRCGRLSSQLAGQTTEGQPTMLLGRRR